MLDRVDQVANVVGEDGEKLVARAHRLGGLTVERGVVDGDGGASREFLSQTKIAVRVLRRCGTPNVGDRPDRLVAGDHRDADVAASPELAEGSHALSAPTVSKNVFPAVSIGRSALLCRRQRTEPTTLAGETRRSSVGFFGSIPRTRIFFPGVPSSSFNMRCEMKCSSVSGPSQSSGAAPVSLAQYGGGLAMSKLRADQAVERGAVGARTCTRRQGWPPCVGDRSSGEDPSGPSLPP